MNADDHGINRVFIPIDDLPDTVGNIQIGANAPIPQSSQSYIGLMGTVGPPGMYGAQGMMDTVGQMGVRHDNNGHLDISHKNLTNLDDYDLSSTVYLNCYNNRLTFIPPSKTIHTLICDHNPLSNFNFADFPSLHTLQIDEIVLLNSNLVEWPTGIVINSNTEKTMENLYKKMKLKLKWKDTFLRYKALAYQPGGEKYLEAEKKLSNMNEHTGC